MEFVDAEPVSEEPVAEDMYGNIEILEGGVLRGWATSRNSAEPLRLQVIAEGRTVGFGVADEYRPDLQKAGIHEGRHAFTIALEEFRQEPGEVHLELVDAETLQKVKHPKFTVKIDAQRFSGYLLRAANGHIEAKVVSTHPIGKQMLTLYHRESLIFKRQIETSEPQLEISFPIPISLQDGQPKLYKMAIDGQPNILAMQWFSIQAIQTPWQHLKESFREPGFLSLPPEASHRYEALHYHLEAIDSGNGILSVQDLLAVHRVIAEGHEGRKRFPVFSLPSFDKPRVSVIVPAYNKFALTYHCIASIALAYNSVSFEVILADDCSSDETAKAEDIVGNLIISRNEKNLCFLHNCNHASRLAKGEFIVFLNNDTEVTSFWIDELVGKMDSDEDIGMTGSKLLNPDGSLQEAGGIVWGNGEPWNVGRNANPLAPEYNYAREVDYLSGAAMCIRRGLWEQIGHFSEDLAPCYYEDTDLAFKAREAGYKTVYVPHSVVVHFEGQSHGRDVTKGLKRYQAVNEQTFRSKWFSVFRKSASPSMDAVNLEKDRNIDQRVLVIDYASPMPDKDAGSYAAFQEMKLMLSLGFKVTFVPDNMVHFGKYTTELQRLGVEVLYTPFYTSVQDALQKRLHEMDAVYITRYSVAEKYLKTIKQHSGVKILFNNADLHFLRELRSALKDQKNQEKLDQVVDTRKREMDVCRQVDAILCYNTTEHVVITSHILESEKLHLTPWVLEEKKPGPKFEQRQGITFLGSYNHHPNVETVEYLAKEVMPLLLETRPDICLSVYGSNMPDSFEVFECENVKIVGFADCLDDVYQNHRVFVAPLLSGSGVKGKVLESMAYGLPTVLTDIAAEGTGLVNGISTLIANNPESLVDSIIKVYDDHQLWTKLSDESKRIAGENLSFESGKRRFKEIFSSVGIFSTH